jgi:aspartyl/asparaginyl beta-hydroxylase (cupin superfamily)
MTMVNAVKEDAEKRGKMIGRIRFMRLKPKTCLTLHRDPDEFRYHIPLETGFNCFFVVGEQIYRMPTLGETYLLDTRDVHTAVNASNHNRIHIVFDTYAK